MKKILIISLLLFIFMLSPITGRSQIPVLSLITAAIKKVITALDIKVQQLQNKTLVLQNAQLRLQNKLSQGKLGDITSWLEKEKKLYEQYYDELKSVKAIIADYGEVKRVIRQQKLIISEYQVASSLFRRDKHFNPDELTFMNVVYDGILKESIRNLNDLMLAVSAYKAQLTDAERLALVHKASEGMRVNLDHLRQFNQQNIRLSLERSRDLKDQDAVRNLYGIH